MNDKVQINFKIKIGKDYPSPLVDHSKARQEALQAFSKIKK